MWFDWQVSDAPLLSFYVRPQSHILCSGSLSSPPAQLVFLAEPSRAATLQLLNLEPADISGSSGKALG